MPDEVLTINEVAPLLKLAERTLYTMAQKDELSAFEIRGQWRFMRVDLDQRIEGQKISTRDDKHRGNA